MSIDRRGFFRVLGIAGLSVGSGRILGAKSGNDPETEFYGILYDSTRCAGCQGCEFACALEHGLPEPDIRDVPVAGTIRKTNENRRSVINVFNTSAGEVYVKTQCMQCNQPACASACLTQAMRKTEEGPVTWNGDRCMGCRYCMISCPFDMPKFEYHSPNPKIVKCNMCFERVHEGKLPACVENCPADALTFGTRRELIAEARRRIYADPDLYHDHIYGEQEAGGTGFLYLSPVPFEELSFNTAVQDRPYPELTRGFLYSVPSIFILWPAILLGIYNATRDHQGKEEENE
jgi:formate dehydrogenase iron-sulfur subunit